MTEDNYIREMGSLTLVPAKWEGHPINDQSQLYERDGIIDIGPSKMGRTPEL